MEKRIFFKIVEKWLKDFEEIQTSWKHYCIILNYLNLNYIMADNKGHRAYNFYSALVFYPVPVEGDGAILDYKIPWLGNYNLLS